MLPTTCPECGTFVRNGWTEECERCGSSLIDHPALIEAEQRVMRERRLQELREKTRMFVVGSVAFVLVFVGVAGVAVYAHSGEVPSLQQVFGGGDGDDTSVPTPVFGAAERER